MEDKKKLTNEEIKNQELTDEQANNVTGGASFFCDFTCNGCNKDFFGAHPFNIGGKKYCSLCYAQNIQGQEQPQRRNAKL